MTDPSLFDNDLPVLSRPPPGIPPSQAQFFYNQLTYPIGWQVAQMHGAALAAWVRALSWSNPGNLFDNPKFAHHYASFRVVYLEMILKRKTTTHPTFERVEWQGFLERPLTEEEVEACDGWKPKPLEVWELVNSVTEAGYQIQASMSDKTGQATATLQDRQAKRSTAGWALSASDDNAALAVKMVLFKHYTILQTDWSGLIGQKPKGKRG